MISTQGEGCKWYYNGVRPLEGADPSWLHTCGRMPACVGFCSGGNSPTVVSRMFMHKGAAWPTTDTVTKMRLWFPRLPQIWLLACGREVPSLEQVRLQVVIRARQDQLCFPPPPRPRVLSFGLSVGFPVSWPAASPLISHPPEFLSLF